MWFGHLSVLFDPIRLRIASRPPRPQITRSSLQVWMKNVSVSWKEKWKLSKKKRFRYLSAGRLRKLSGIMPQFSHSSRLHEILWSPSSSAEAIYATKNFINAVVDEQVANDSTSTGNIAQYLRPIDHVLRRINSREFSHRQYRIPSLRTRS